VSGQSDSKIEHRRKMQLFTHKLYDRVVVRSLSCIAAISGSTVIGVECLRENVRAERRRTIRQTVLHAAYL